MDQLTAFVHGSFNVSSVHILESCFASEVALVQTMADGALDTTVQTAESTPWQVFSGVTLACALGLLFLGWYLVRAVNFFGGLYIGASLSLFVLSLAATGTPLAANCIAMLSIVSGSALLIAIICVVKRKSMYLLLGLIAGEIIGKFVYHLALEHSEFFDFGTNTLYVSVGFFAVLGAYAVKEIGDLAWMICTALMGAYFATTALVELVVVPFVPDGASYGAFLAYRPTPTTSAAGGAAVDDVLHSKYLWAPFGAMMLLTLIGLLTQLACYNQMMRKRKRYEVPLVAP
jgi:hypothetical protein